MKRFLVMLLISCTVAMAAGIKWEKDYATAVKQSKTLNKPMMFVISNHNCRFCVQFDNTTLKNPKVVQKLNAEYVNVLVYVDENPVFPRELLAGGTPATWFLKDNTPMFQPVMGAVDPDSFLNALNIVKKEYAAQTQKK